MTRHEQLARLLLDIEEYGRDIQNDLEQIIVDANKLYAAAEEIRLSSSGSAFGYHADLYYGNFEHPPARFNVEFGGQSQHAWRPRPPEQVRGEIENRSGVSEKALNDYVEAIIRRTIPVQEEVLSSCAFVLNESGMEGEKGVAEKGRHVQKPTGLRNGLKYAVKF